MNTEIEAKFCGVDHDAVREKLRELGAILETPMRMMRRVTFDNDAMKAKGGWIRVRDEGEKTTVTYKQINSLTLEGVQEIELEVSDFDAMVAVFRATALAGGSFQESKREGWKFENVEIVLDEWPWLKPYIEVEGPDTESVARVARLLGYDMNNAVYGDVMSAYGLEYPFIGPKDTVGNLPFVRFGDPLPDFLEGSSGE